MSNHKHSIVDGPDSIMLFDALKYAYGYLEATVKFIYLAPNRADKLSVKMRITALQHEDSSGNSFNFQAKIEVNSKEVSVNGYYNSKTRKGHFAY